MERHASSAAKVILSTAFCVDSSLIFNVHLNDPLQPDTVPACNPPQFSVSLQMLPASRECPLDCQSRLTSGGLGGESRSRDFCMPAVQVSFFPSPATKQLQVRRPYLRLLWLPRSGKDGHGKGYRRGSEQDPRWRVGASEKEDERGNLFPSFHCASKQGAIRNLLPTNGVSKSAYVQEKEAPIQTCSASWVAGLHIRI